MDGPFEVEELAMLDGSLAGATGWAIGLSSTAPAEDGTGITEPAEASYARVAVAAADFGAAVGGAATTPSSKSNVNAFTFPTATEDWAAGANLTHWVIWDAAATPVPRWAGLLDTAKPVLNGDTAELAAGACVLELGKPTDTFS